jgi:hypothetical protein
VLTTWQVITPNRVIEHYMCSNAGEVQTPVVAIMKKSEGNKTNFYTIYKGEIIASAMVHN